MPRHGAGGVRARRACASPIPGRCLLSGYFNRRDPNQGTCTNACRWEYKHPGRHRRTRPAVKRFRWPRLDEGFNFAQEAQAEAETAFARPAAAASATPSRRPGLPAGREAGRPGELMPIMEDEHGTYIMNSKDLRAVEHVARLAADRCIDSLKIEGRTKSLYYVARTAQVYRRSRHRRRPWPAGRSTPNCCSSSKAWPTAATPAGCWSARPAHDYQNYITGHSELPPQPFRGRGAAGVRADALGREWKPRTASAVGDRLEVIHPAATA